MYFDITFLQGTFGLPIHFYERLLLCTANSDEE